MTAWAKRPAALRSDAVAVTTLEAQPNGGYRIAGASIPRQGPPPPDGWPGTHRWPLVHDARAIRRAVDVLCNTELPADLQELGQLLRRVLAGPANLQPADPDGGAARISHPVLGPAPTNPGSDRAR